ncbi:MAG: hypothetical protein SGPRY_012922, partial [Prymnesium sp.]
MVVPHRRAPPRDGGAQAVAARPVLQPARPGADRFRRINAAQGGKKLKRCKDAVAILLLLLFPPSRVGVIRELRLGHTLQRRADGAGWAIKLSKQRDGHETSKARAPLSS